MASSNNIKNLESKSIYILREAKKRFQNPALLWSIGKDSTTILWMAKKAFYGSIPFKIIHIDTGMKFPEMYAFRKKIADLWKLDLLIAGPPAESNLPDDAHPDKDKFRCCMSRKTDALKNIVSTYGFDSLIVGIRRDEHGIRGKERFFSPRDNNFKWNTSKIKSAESEFEGDSPLDSLQDPELSGWNLFATDFGPSTNHIRVHPILHWSELDIWEYIKHEDIPILKLYFAENGKRYRSLGCIPCTKPIQSHAANINEICIEISKSQDSERMGRTNDKENDETMEKLRSLGYM